MCSYFPSELTDALLMLLSLLKSSDIAEADGKHN